MRTAEGDNVVCRGRGRMDGDRANADGSFTMTSGGIPEKIIFLINTHSALEAEELFQTYERMIAKKGWEETTRATEQFEDLLRAAVRESRQDNQTVMHVADVSGDIDAVEVVKGLKVAPLIPRAVGRLGMQVGAAVSGQTVGEFGKVIRKEKIKLMPRIAGLIGV